MNLSVRVERACKDSFSLSSLLNNVIVCVSNGSFGPAVPFYVNPRVATCELPVPLRVQPVQGAAAGLEGTAHPRGFHYSKEHRNRYRLPAPSNSVGHFSV